MFGFEYGNGNICAAEDVGRGAGVGLVIIGAVGATPVLLTPSITAAGAPIGATGAMPVLSLRAPAVVAGEDAADPSYFLRVSLRNCLCWAARVLYSLHLRSESEAASTSGVVCSVISGRVLLASMASGAKVALNILFLQKKKHRLSSIAQKQSKHLQKIFVYLTSLSCASEFDIIAFRRASLPSRRGVPGLKFVIGSSTALAMI